MDNAIDLLDFPIMRRPIATPSDRPVPHYGLYGETAFSTGLEPLHVETLAARSNAHGWTIKPHRHSDLHQIMWLADGGGDMLVETEKRRIEAPRLIAISPGVVHGFQWDGRVDGFILMVTSAFMERAPLQRDALDFVLDVRPQDVSELAQAFGRLHSAFQGDRPGRVTALFGHALVILAGVLGSVAQHRGAAASRDGQAELARRFRALVEDVFRDQPSVGDMAAMLKVTTLRLNRACSAITGLAPQAVLHERVLLEAKRLLTYTTAPIAEIAYGLGFSDPAYFSRFFSKREGCAPAVWRLKPIAQRR